MAPSVVLFAAVLTGLAQMGKTETDRVRVLKVGDPETHTTYAQALWKII